MNDILSIVITVKNRSLVEWEGIDTPLSPLPNCIASIGQLFSKKDKVQIVIADWMSTDYPLRNWMPDMCRNPYKIIDIEKEGFSRGFGINEAVKHTMGDTIFIMDADMILTSRDIVNNGMKIVREGGVYFPVPKYIVNMKGEYRYNCGVGNVIISKETFNTVGGIPEYYRYGFEDSDFFKRVKNSGAKVFARNEPSFIHPWHPQSLAFKEQYIDSNLDNDVEIEQRSIEYTKLKEDNEHIDISVLEAD